MRCGINAMLLMVPLAGVGAQTNPAGLVGDWNFDEGEGTLDASGQGNAATLVGATLVAGRIGRAAHLDGAGGHVDFPESAAYAFTGKDSFTVDLWIRTRRQDFCTPLMARDGNDVSFSFVLGRQPGRIAFELWSWGTVKLISKTNVGDGAWHHVVGSHDAATGYAVLQVDGRVEALARPGQGGPAKTLLRLGNNIGTDQFFTGDVDALRLARDVPPEVRAAIAEHTRWMVLDDQRLRDMQQAYLERMEAPRNPHAATPAEWDARRQAVKRHVFDSLGLTPEPARLPLDIHWGGRLERDGYSLQRLYWQTWPNYYAAGYLYLPQKMAGKLPAVLNPHGHWGDGNRNPVVQARMIALARKGYIALTIDSVHAYDYYSGVTPLTVMMWNDIRAMDLLCSMPEVDTTRIGCTGCSGGGQQTFYMMAMDDRIAAAVPVNMVCEYRRILSIDVAHCPCNHVAGIAAETDQTEMAACLAPKPSFYICVTQDWTFKLPTEGYPEIKSVFDVYGQPDHVGIWQQDWYHDYNQLMREHMYTWFNRWLKGVDDPEQGKEAPFEAESLDTLRTLDAPPAGAAGQEAIFAERRATRAAAFDTASAASVAASAERLRTALPKVLREPEGAPAPTFEEQGGELRDGLSILKLLVRTEPDVSVPVILVEPEKRAGKLPALLLADSAGKAALIDHAWPQIVELVKGGRCVALTDPRFLGEWSARAEVQRLNGILFGRPEAAVGSHDLAEVARWLRGRAEVDPAKVFVVGLGDAGVMALLAAALEPAIAGAAAPAVGPTYGAGRTAPAASHLVSVGDLPALAAALAPRPVWLSGTGTDAAWDATRRAYGALDATAALSVAPDAADLGSAALTDWLRRVPGVQ